MKYANMFEQQLSEKLQYNSTILQYVFTGKSFL